MLPESGTDYPLPPTPCIYEPNVFLMSLLLFFATFLLAVRLKAFKDAPMFNLARKTVSDFAVPLALLATTLTDYYAGVNTPKLQVRLVPSFNMT